MQDNSGYKSPAELKKDNDGVNDLPPDYDTLPQTVSEDSVELESVGEPEVEESLQVEQKKTFRERASEFGSTALQKTKEFGAAAYTTFRDVRGDFDPLTDLKKGVEENRKNGTNGRYGEGNPAQVLFNDIAKGFSDLDKTDWMKPIGDDPKAIAAAKRDGGGIFFDSKKSVFRAFGDANLTPEMMQFNALIDSKMIKPFTDKKSENINNKKVNRIFSKKHGIYANDQSKINEYDREYENKDGPNFYVTKNATAGFLTNSASDKARHKDKVAMYGKKEMENADGTPKEGAPGKMAVAKFVGKQIAKATILYAPLLVLSTFVPIVGIPLLVGLIGKDIAKFAGSRIASKFKRAFDKKSQVNKKLKNFGMGKDKNGKDRCMRKTKSDLHAIDQGMLTMREIEDKGLKDSYIKKGIIKEVTGKNGKTDYVFNEKIVAGGMLGAARNFVQSMDLPGSWKPTSGFGKVAKFILKPIPQLLWGATFGLGIAIYKAKKRYDVRKEFRNRKGLDQDNDVNPQNAQGDMTPEQRAAYNAQTVANNAKMLQETAQKYGDQPDSEQKNHDHSTKPQPTKQQGGSISKNANALSATVSDISAPPITPPVPGQGGGGHSLPG